MKLLQTLFVIVLSCTSLAASAQGLWLDKDGRKVFRDRAPPPDVLDKNILKRPTGRGPSPLPAAEPTDTNATAAPNAPPLVPAANKTAGVDKELETKKKQAAEAEAAKRKEAEEKVAKAKIENCARAKQSKATFDSGVRISRTNAAGEREVLDDAARAAELKRIQDIMAADCK
jgi:type IV secretory pathway VirB10-like protein